MNAQAEIRSQDSSAIEAWRPALIAFYENDERPIKAKTLRLGAPLDYLDACTIGALQAALKVAP